MSGIYNYRPVRMELWALVSKDGAMLYHGNVPALYDSRKDAWYDGDDEFKPRKVKVAITTRARSKATKEQP